jgi:SAM-dependent methyltransferase
MMQPTASSSGSGERWGPLWGARASDWAANEEQQAPTYEEAIARVGIEPGQLVLDLGCGSGVFLRVAAERGAKGFGLDASSELIEIARRRVPGADLRVGEMEALPYEDDTFDLVTGFNSFFFAADLVAAVREAARVAKPGAPVLIQVWGRPERCQLEAMKEVARPLLPKPSPEQPPPPQLWKPGVLEAIAAAAGLAPEAAFDVVWAYEYPDRETLARAMVAPAGIATLAGPEREPALREAVVDALAPFRTASGGYRLENEFHILIARA